MNLRHLIIIAILSLFVSACSDGCSEEEPEEEPPPGVERLHFGTYHVCTLDDRQTVWCTGSNDYGQLGDGTTTKRSDLTEVAELGPMVGLAVGFFDTTCAWNDEGELFCWGNNDHGVLADDELEYSSTPVRIDELPPVVDVSLGAFHACALTEEQRVYCWGNHSRGQLGIDIGVGPIVYTPTEVELLPAARKVRAGGEHTCAIDQEGTLYCWGHNGFGQLGLGDDLPGTTIPRVVEGAPGNAVDLEVAFRHSCAVFGERRELYCWGTNDYGQLGLDDLERRTTPTEVPEIAYVDELAVAGGQVCVRIDRRVYCAGEVLRPVEMARQTGDGYFFTPSQSLHHTTELWSGVLAVCGRAETHAIACRGVQHQALGGDLF